MSALKINWNSWRWVGLAAMVIVCVALLGKPVSRVAAQPIHMPTFESPLAAMGFAPAELTLENVNDTGTTAIQVTNVSNMAGVEFRITFNPAYVQVTSATAGPFFNQNGVPMPIVPVFDNITGKVDFVGSVAPPAVPFSGAGPVVVADITWKLVSCPQGGSFPLPFSNTKVSDPNGGAISHTAGDGKIKCGPVVPEGKVLLQGRTNHSGTTLYLTEDACPLVQAVSVKGLPNVVTGVTDAAGNFKLAPLPGHTYQCLLATHDMYLTARRSNVTVALPQVTLLGGNVVADKTINIFDLARIANSIGASDPAVDINGDGKVDVYDLTIAAGNFGKEGPLPW